MQSTNSNAERRRMLHLATTLFVGGITTGCAQTKQPKPLVKANDEKISDEQLAIYLRHCPVFAIGANPPKSGQSILNYFWSLTCSDSATYFSKEMVGLMREIDEKKDRTLYVHYLARTNNDVENGLRIRGLKPYAEVSIALMANAVGNPDIFRRNSNDKVRALIRRTASQISASPDETIDQNLARASLIAQNTVAFRVLGLTGTPSLFIDGKNVPLTQFRQHG